MSFVVRPLGMRAAVPIDRWSSPGLAEGELLEEQSLQRELGVHIGAGGKQRRNNVPVSPNCSHMQRRQAVGGGNPRVRARAYQQVDDRTFRTTDVWMRVTHKHGIKQWRATHAAYAKFFIVRPTQSVHVGSRVQKRIDAGNS